MSAGLRRRRKRTATGSEKSKENGLRPSLFRTFVSRATEDDDDAQQKLGETELAAGLNPLITEWSTIDALLIICLLLAALATRFWRLSVPNQVVFDEFHFGKFLNWYLRGEYLFDIHPPLGKLVFYSVARFVGYEPGNFMYDNIGATFPKGYKYTSIRAVSAIAGSVLVPVMYSTARNFRMSIETSFMAACFVLLDVSFTIESRLILVDSQLFLSCALALLAMSQLWKTTDGTWSRALWIVLSGLACGCAISVKWTGLATPGVTGLVCLLGLYFTPRRRPIPLLQCASIGLIGLSLYMMCWKIHFDVLQRSGDGDAFMDKRFQQTLIGNRHYDPEVSRENLLARTWKLNREMYIANRDIKTTHPWQSKWHEWPYIKRGLLFYTGQLKSVNFVGNPLVYGSVLASLVIFLASQLVIYAFLFRCASLPRRHAFINFTAHGLLFSAGWIINLLPYIGIQRCAFLYHYLPALWYGILLNAVVLERLVPRRIRFVLCSGLILMAGLMFYYFAPWIYAMPIPDELNHQMQWTRGWE